LPMLEQCAGRSETPGAEHRPARGSKRARKTSLPFSMRPRLTVSPPARPSSRMTGRAKAVGPRSSAKADPVKKAARPTRQRNVLRSKTAKPALQRHQQAMGGGDRKPRCAGELGGGRAVGPVRQRLEHEKRPLDGPDGAPPAPRPARPHPRSASLAASLRPAFYPPWGAWQGTCQGHCGCPALARSARRALVSLRRESGRSGRRDRRT
jgi:hypothetical protein